MNSLKREMLSRYVNREQRIQLGLFILWGEEMTWFSLFCSGERGSPVQKSGVTVDWIKRLNPLLRRNPSRPYSNTKSNENKLGSHVQPRLKYISNFTSIFEEQKYIKRRIMISF